MKMNTNEAALTILEHSISYLLISSASHSEINDACDILYAAHKSIGPCGEISPSIRGALVPTPSCY